jgi:amino acid transporter
LVGGKGLLSTAAPARRRRRVKIRGGTLGPFLCWAVVFADIGTSVYYVPGILYGHFGTRSALFVTMTLGVFVLLCLKYAEVAWRYPEGGGVVTVASRALHPFVGLLGGLFILVDYYLTAALSALSGVIYMSVVAPQLGVETVAITVGALIGLGLLNALGIRDSARASAAIAIVAGIGQLLVVIVVAVHLGPAGIVQSFGALRKGPPLTPILLITGYGAAFLAFSGLESIAQIAPAMRDPRYRTAYRAMALVIVTMAVTSPLLTLWSTTLLDARNADPNQFISILGAHFAGPTLGGYVAISGSLLLIFASNTAIIGAYHVFIALARMGFLPRVLERRNRWRGTPHFAILAAVVLPVAVVSLSRGNVDLLGDLYAFGLLGAFTLTCLGLDIVRWHELRTGQGRALQLNFAIGVLTTFLVLVAWLVNLIAKPLATEFGGGLTLLGLTIGLATYLQSRRRRPSVFPLPYSPQRAAQSIENAFRRRPAEILVILPHDPDAAVPVIGEAVRAARGRDVVFLYRGDTALPAQELWEVADPYLNDFPAQDAFARAEMLARRSIPDRRYVYVPGHLRRELIGNVWREVHPRETVLEQSDKEMLPPIAIDRVRRKVVDGVPVLHLITGRPAQAVPAGT